MAQPTGPQRKRGTYHHGDLRAAVVEAGLALTRAGGPEALSMREVARSVGVAPNAAYRHVRDRDDLLHMVAVRVQEQMAHSMRLRMRSPRDSSPLERAVARLRGVGAGYISFALTEPGWFAVFCAQLSTDGPAVDRSPDDVPPPFALLEGALSDLVALGALPADRQAGAIWSCWSTVHGFASLAASGPLKGLSRVSLIQQASYAVDAIIAGVLVAEGPAGWRQT